MHLRAPHIKAYQKPNGCDQVPRPTPSTTREHHMEEEVLNPIHDDTPLGRGIILSHFRDNHKNRIDHLPDICIFLRACFQSFHELRVSQDTTLLTHQPIGEPRSGATTGHEPVAEELGMAAWEPEEKDLSLVVSLLLACCIVPGLDGVFSGHLVCPRCGG